MSALLTYFSSHPPCQQSLLPRPLQSEMLFWEQTEDVVTTSPTDVLVESWGTDEFVYT